MAKSDTRLKMIQTAADLFHRQGVNATSVDQILAKSGTGKSQFSHYFKTKNGLIQASLKYLHEIVREGKTPTGYNVKTWKDMEQWFQKYIDFQKSVDFERSCPIGTIGNDISSGQPYLRREVIAFFEWGRGQLVQFFGDRKTAGELIPEADPEALADFCISIMEGGMLLTKMQGNTHMFENAAKQALAHLKSLRKKKT